MFGHTDLANNKAFMEAARSFKKKLHVQASGKKKLIPRHFSAKAIINCDLMTLALEDLDEMKLEFPDVFFQVLEEGRSKLKEHLAEEIKAKRYLNRGETNLFSKLGQAMMKKMEKDILNDKPPEKEKKSKHDPLASTMKSARGGHTNTHSKMMPRISPSARKASQNSVYPGILRS
jgi:hypothetical protein